MFDDTTKSSGINQTFGKTSTSSSVFGKLSTAPENSSRSGASRSKMSTDSALGDRTNRSERDTNTSKTTASSKSSAPPSRADKENDPLNTLHWSGVRTGRGRRMRGSQGAQGQVRAAVALAPRF
jgi:hypothetical protein